jgi:pimeloyl-ACP methyl ester carboxylesterase
MNSKQNGNNSVVIFIHGIKGSTLVNEKGSLVWLTGSQALGFDTPKLSLPERWNGEFQEKDHIKSGEVLSKVKVIPLLLEEKVYSPWLDAMKNSYGNKFFPFAYDWRRDNLESLAFFESFVEKIKSDNPNANITVVAHSMGGLIALALLNKRPEFFQRVVFAGVPFNGGIGFLEDMHLGTSDGLNKKILSKEVLFTMPSVYTLFPLETKKIVVAEDSSGNPIEIDFFSADDWKNNKLSIFSNDTTSDFTAKVNFLAKALLKAKAFKEQLKAVKIKYPPMLVISGKAHPTLSKIQKNGKHSFNGWDFESLPREVGDGRVLEKNSFPPSTITYETFYSDKKHSALLNDPAVIAKINEFINK